MAIGDIYKVRFACFTANQVGLNIRHYRVTAETVPTPSAQQMAEGFDVIFRSLFKDLLSVSAEYLGVGVQRIRPLPPLLEGFTVASRGAGTVLGEVLPHQIAGIISYQTIFAGRRFRGRSYIPFPGEADNGGDGKTTAGYGVRQGNLLNAMLLPRTIVAGLGSISLFPEIFHRVDGTSTPIVAGFTRVRWGTQRRRGQFGRPNEVPF